MHHRVLIDEWVASPLPFNEFCRRHGVSVKSLRRWMRDAGISKPSEPTKSAVAPKFLRLDVASQRAERPVAESAVCASTSSLTVMVGAIRVVVDRGFDPALLRDVLATLTEAGR